MQYVESLIKTLSIYSRYSNPKLESNKLYDFKHVVDEAYKENLITEKERAEIYSHYSSKKRDKKEALN